MIQPLSKTDFINILKSIYPADYVDAMLNGAGGVYIDIYASLFSQIIATYVPVQQELYFNFADGGWLDLLAWGERGLVRAPGETDAAFIARITAPLDTITPQAMLNTANNSLGALGYAKNAVYYDVGIMPGVAFDTLATFIDPITGDLFPMSAFDSGVRMWSLETIKAFFVVIVPEYTGVMYGFHSDALTILDQNSGYPAGSHIPISAMDFNQAINEQGAPMDGDISSLNTGLYSAIWNQLNVIKAAGIGFNLEIGVLD
jgi:hypothetical protein